jgi:polyisoprenoid-binding protein YceI
METKNSWVLDPTHSEIQFKVKHLMMTNVTGAFKVLHAGIAADENFSDAKVNFTADINSVDTGNAQRDGHLKGGDFFDAEKFPELSFVSTHYNAAENKITGDLTVKGVTKPVTLDVEYNGAHKDPWGNLKAGFSVSGKINRKDWGLAWNAALEGGGVLVSEDVKINAELQFVKQA